MIRLHELYQISSSSAGNHSWEAEYTIPQDRAEYLDERVASREAAILPEPKGYERAPRRFRGGRDEFAEGQVQHLPKIQVQQARERDLDFEPVSLDHQEQNDILSRVNRRLSQCAFDFIAMYQFPIPLEAGKPMVRVATDRAWTEWVYLLKRLATKRRIPSRAIYDGQIKELTTLLDNSVEMRHSTKPQARPLKDDRHVLQLVSAGIQVGRMLKDATTMEYLDRLYKDTEVLIQVITRHKEGCKRPQAINKSSTHSPADPGCAESLTIAGWVSYLASNPALYMDDFHVIENTGSARVQSC